MNEDVDWCVRARKLGYRVVYVDTAAIHHRGASSADLSKPIVFSYGYFLGRNAILFARKHANPLQFAWLLLMMVLGVAMRISAFALSAALRAIFGQEPFISGMIDGLPGRLRRDKITIRMPVLGRAARHADRPPAALARRMSRGPAARDDARTARTHLTCS